MPVSQASTGPLSASFFLQSGGTRPIGRKPGPGGPDGPGAGAAEAAYGAGGRSHVPGAGRRSAGDGHAGTDVAEQAGGRVGRAVCPDLVAPANPLHRGGRPLAGFVPGPLAGGSDRRIERRRDAPERPAENPAAPNEHHHLFVVGLDLFLDPPRGGAPTHGVVDLSAVFLHLRHDTKPVGPVADRARHQARDFARNRAGSRARGAGRRPNSGSGPGDVAGGRAADSVSSREPSRALL